MGTEPLDPSVVTDVADLEQHERDGEAKRAELARHEQDGESKRAALAAKLGEGTVALRHRGDGQVMMVVGGRLHVVAATYLEDLVPTAPTT
jgi:hypothetical protein